jgi:putative transposase
VRRAHVPAQRGEAGSPRKGQTTQAGIPGLQAREHVKKARYSFPAGVSSGSSVSAASVVFSQCTSASLVARATLSNP